MSQERGKERALQAYPPDGGECGRESCDWNHDKREGYERGYNDAMAEPREWSDKAVLAALDFQWACDVTRFFVCDPEGLDLEMASMRAVLQVADKAEKARTA